MGQQNPQSGVKTLFVGIGSIFALLAVGLGAFGAHALKDKLEAASYLATYETAVQYHMMHALGLVLIGLLLKSYPDSSLLHWSGWLLAIGIVIFSGSLYTLSLTGIKVLGAITPIGGVAFLLGWLLLAVFAFKTLS